MKIINRMTKELALFGGRAKTRLYVTIKENQVYFTAAASRLCEMEKGLYVHFLNEGEDWSFFVNDDPDGFKLSYINSKCGFIISNTGLTSMMLKSMGVKNEKRLAIEPTNAMQDKCKIWKLSNTNVSNVIR